MPTETIASLDCATSGADYLVFLVGRVTSEGVKVIAKFRRQKVTMTEAIATIAAMTARYEISRIVVETTGGVGELYRQQLIERSDIRAGIIGFNTTAQSKPIAIERLALFLERGWLQISDPQIADELKAFQRNGRKLEAASGKHDDTVMALAFLVSIVEIDRLQYGDRDPTSLRFFATEPKRYESVPEARNEFRSMFGGD
jgi:hypothetical protein